MGAFVVVSLLVGACGGGERAQSRHLVIISLDTVRRDHLPVYGYARDTAPAVSVLAEGAVVFNNAFTQHTLTNPSHTSMFTGVFPHVHGNQTNRHHLAQEQVTLAQVLQRSGFSTGGFVSAVTMSGQTTGLERGFDVYEDGFTSGRRDGRVATNLAVDWLRERTSDERFFLFLHLYDAHGPYRPPPPYDTTFRSTGPGALLPRVPPYQALRDERERPLRGLNRYVDLYDGGIRYADELVASLLQELDLDDTIVLVLSDHGETLGERYWTLDHGGQVFDEQIRIPLILRVPGVRPSLAMATVQTVDLLPTVLELLGVELPPDRPVAGRSLVPLLEGGPTTGRDVSFASAQAVEVRHGDRQYQLDPQERIHSVRTPRWKLITYPGQGHRYVELYDLRSDAAESVNVAERFTEVRDTLLETLDEWRKGGSASGAAPDLDPRTLEQLRALGYIGG